MIGSLVLKAVTAFLFVTNAFALVWWFLGRQQFDGVACNDVAFFPNRLFNAISSVAIAALVLWLTSVATTPHIRSVTAYMQWNYAVQLQRLLSDVCWCDTAFYKVQRTKDSTVLSEVLWPFAIFFVLNVIIAGYDLAVSRIQTLEANALLSFKTALLPPLLRTAVVLNVLLSTAFALRGEPWALPVLGALVLLLVAVWLLGTVLLTRALLQALRLLRAAAKSAPEAMALLARSSYSELRKEVVIILLSVVTSAGMLAWMAFFALFQPKNVLAFTSLLGIVDIASNSFMALLQSGALSGAVQGTGRRAMLMKQRWRRRAQALRQKEESVAQGWEEVVADLAKRGMSLSALLAFYRELPGRMPHFDAARHTTADVVGQVIIPMTAEKRCAAVEVVMEGKCVRPAKMVTHAWANLFRDLVAAIVADAFEEPEYAFFSELLEQDLATLEEWVQSSRRGAKSYWICAFSVNQHLSICEAKNERRDRVTGLPFPSCSCGSSKAMNDTPPLLADGRSVPCEMNKFADMIRCLAKTDPAFSQVVPIDAHFQTFTRAWCIAEMATACDLGMVQDVKIGSSSELKKHRGELQRLRIQDMQASRKEDKEAILASIADHDAFNESVQRLLFEDLLPKWDSWDAQERMACAGRIIRWHETEVWKEQQRRISSSVSV